MLERVKESWNVLTGKSNEAITFEQRPEPDAHLWQPMGATCRDRNLP